MRIMDQDLKLLTELTSRHLESAPDTHGYLSVDFDDLVEWASSHSIDADSLSDSITVLESYGWAQATRALARYPRTVRPTTAGVEHVIRTFVDDYDFMLARLADVACDGKQHRSSELGIKLGIAPKLIEHALSQWQSTDWVLLSRSIGEVHLIEAKAGLRRWREDINRASMQPTPATAEAAPAQRRRRVWGERWDATSEHPVATRGQGAVWKVRDLRDQALKQERPLYALKELRHPKPTTSTAYKRFRREVDAMTTLGKTNSGIATVVDAHLPEDEGKQQPYYVMPWAPQTLERAKFLEGPSSLEKVIEIGIALSETLRACHDACPRIVHRDVKPGNVLLYGPELTPKLADFGICFLDDPDRLTRTEADTVGSAGFTAPELEGGGTVDVDNVGPAADIYSLGKTLYAVLAGGDVFPREAHNEEKFNLAVKFKDPRLAHVHGILERMVAPKPEDRFASMEQCRDQLLRALENIRAGVSYQPGMYGAGETAQERVAALTRAMQHLAGAERSDTIVRALDRAESTAVAIADAFETKYPSLRAPAGQPFVDGFRPAAEVADHLLAAGLPLVLLEEDEFFEEWVVRLSDLAVRDGNAVSPKRMVLAAGAVLALYGAAVAAWERRRTVSLGTLVGRHSEARGDWIHLKLLGGSAAQLLPWVVKSLSNSALFEGALPITEERVAAFTPVLPALSAWHRLVLASPEEQTLIEAFRFDEVDLAAFPICYAESVEWASLIARACRQSPGLERSVAREIFGVEPAVLRSTAARLTPAFLRRCAALLLEVGRDGFWGLGSEWDTWVGVPPS